MVNKRVTNKMIKTLSSKPVATFGGEELKFANNSGDHVKSIKTNTPVNDTDLTNKSYVDTQDAATLAAAEAADLWEVDGTETQLKTADEIDMQSKKILNLANGTANTDAVNKGQMDTADALKVPYTGATASVDLGGHNLTVGETNGDAGNIYVHLGDEGGGEYNTRISGGELYMEAEGSTLTINPYSTDGYFNNHFTFFGENYASIGTYNTLTLTGAPTEVIGDFYFKNSGSGLPFGEIYVNGNTTATTISVQNTWYQFTGFNTNGQSNLTTPDHTNDHITITKAGIYKIDFNVSFSGGGGKTYEVSVYKNNGATACPNIHIERKLGAAGDIGAAAASGFVSCSANDTIELWIRCTDVTTANATLRDVNLNVLQVGG